MKNKVLSALVVSAMSMPVVADEWINQIGVSYASGIEDVVDIYEDNLDANPYYAVDRDEVSLIPVGASYSGYYQFDNGFRAGIGAGPLFLILGDVDHTEIPVNVTAGWTFAKDERFSPFVNAGLTKHFVSGDYVEGDSVGLLVEAGATYGQFGAKLAMDDSEVDLQTINGVKAVNTYGTVLTVFAEF